jgi:ribulose 1,5-bisphosphate carboxylase large subunit-like protein
MMRARSCQRTRSRKQLQSAMPTTTATLQLAPAAHGIGEHRHPAQNRIQHCIQPCASSLCATPAMPSTMLNHVDKEFVTPLGGGWNGHVDGAGEGLRLTLKILSTS